MSANSEPFGCAGRIAVATLTLASLMLAPAFAEDACLRQTREIRGADLLANVCLALSAVNHGDAAALRALMADDFALTGNSGTYFAKSKVDMIRRWTAAPEPGSSATSKVTRIYRVFHSADIGFVAGEIEDRSIDKQGAHCMVHAFTDIWVRRERRWVWIQSHESGARDQACAD